MQDQASLANGGSAGAGLMDQAPIAVTLPDGTCRKFAGPLGGGEIAAAIGPGLAKAAIAICIDGRLRDLATVVDAYAGPEIFRTWLTRIG